MNLSDKTIDKGGQLGNLMRYLLKSLVVLVIGFPVWLFGYVNSFIPYRIPKDSFALAERVLVNPLDSTETVVSEGKVLYTRFCNHCHGEDGQVAGKVGEVYLGVPTYASAAIKDKKEGHVYHVIANGKGRMTSHASQLSVEERWKIVRYVQILQKQ